VTQRPGLWWGAAATTTVLGAAAWLRAPSAPTLVLSAAAAITAMVLAWRGRQGRFQYAFGFAALAFALVAGRAEQERGALGGDAQRSGADVQARATAALVAAIEAEGEALQRLAVEALDAPPDAAGAFARLDALRAGAPVRAVVLARGTNALAWSGRLVAPLDSLPGPVGIVATPFFLTLYAISGRGTDRAAAEALIHVEPPADRIATALDGSLVRRFGVEGFAYRDAQAAAKDSFAVARIAGVPVLGVRALPPSGALLEARAIDRGRTRGALALAIALCCYLGALWRRGSGLGGRLAALGVSLGVVATVPLSSFSNASALFDPAIYYAAFGGPFTGSIGALALTCAFVLLGLLAALRARVGFRSRAQSLVAVIAIAGVGPFLLRDLARGIRFPASGITTSLWLAWEATLFLAAVSVLIAGATAGRAALGARRGVPVWIAPTIAAVAALLAPPLLEAPGAYPAWYPALWVLAIGALALARRARGAVLPIAIVAACGAVTLLWGQSVRERVGLAERDVAALGTSDPAVKSLLERFPMHLDPASAPKSRVELLARYAASDLADGDYPADVTSWDPQGRVIADLRVAMGPGTSTGIDVFAREASGSPRPILREVPSIPAMLLVLSVPHVDHSVTTVVVAPRTRLLPRDAFGALLGLGSPPAADAPYSLRLGDPVVGGVVSSVARWTRRGSELHGDWFLPTTRGRFVRVHAQVELRGYEALATRGALTVFFDLGVLALLWLLMVIPDGVFGRWMRMRRRRWMRSYRAQLTLALFAFFVLPAAAFAAWSYRRLQQDDQQARDLLVRETLRGVAASTDSVRLAEIAARFDTPLFLFANGILIGASDPLLEALAPIGRLLPPAAERAITESDDVAASAEVLVGTTPIRFGFRVAVDTAAANVKLVLAAPARTDDFALDRRRRDLGILVMFASALGALGALWLSGLIARRFSTPIRALQRGAEALAAGEREPRLEGDPPVEFQPVFSAFRRMARDLEAGREQEARAQRVLAWGEMARQVAHEIKNPLTPMRLGMQHLRRARNDPRVNFDQVLDENVTRVLSEIDRLDEIARAFSQYGMVPREQAAAEPVDVAEAVRDVVRLEQLGETHVAWLVEGADASMMAMARPTELREVVLNLLENSRQASAHHVTVTLSRDDRAVWIRVADDGHGIDPEVLSRLFEPHFSTRTSGSGLGLAISRRLIESWGGSIEFERALGRDGTVVRITLVPSGPG
jgi:signal transduction histidine kinase